MFCGIIPGKESLRLFLRRHIINSNLERKSPHPRTLQDCVVEPKNLGCRKTWFLVLTLPVLYYASSVLLQDTLVVNKPLDPPGAPGMDKWIEKNLMITVGYRGPQLKVPTQSPNLANQDYEKASLWQSYWTDYREKTLRLFQKLQKKKQYTAAAAVLTPQPLILPTPTSPTTKNPMSEPCEIHHNFSGNVNTSLRLSDINDDLETIYPMVQKGGFYKPPDCWSRHKVAIIVSYNRNHSTNLKVFLYNIHPFLMAQKLEYQIFVIEHTGPRFNRGRIYNTGFREIEKWGKWGCVIFHSMNLLPVSSKILYTCPMFPKHMSSAVVFPNGTNQYNRFFAGFGGVTAVTIEHYKKVNGHSSIYWDSDCVDIDIYKRFRYVNLPVVRNKKSVSVFVELPHQNEMQRSCRLPLQNAGERSPYEGLSSLQYVVRKLSLHHLYTHIVVELDSSTIDITNNKEISHPALSESIEDVTPTLPWGLWKSSTSAKIWAPPELEN